MNMDESAADCTIYSCEFKSTYGTAGSVMRNTLTSCAEISFVSYNLNLKCCTFNVIPTCFYFLWEEMGTSIRRTGYARFQHYASFSDLQNCTIILFESCIGNNVSEFF